MRDVARCDREIAEVERLLRAGHRDIEGLCRALVDWSVERRILKGSLIVEKPEQTVEGGLLEFAGGEGRARGAARSPIGGRRSSPRATSLLQYKAWRNRHG